MLQAGSQLSSVHIKSRCWLLCLSTKLRPCPHSLDARAWNHFARVLLSVKRRSLVCSLHERCLRNIRKLQCSLVCSLHERCLPNICRIQHTMCFCVTHSRILLLNAFIRACILEGKKAWGTNYKSCALLSLLSTLCQVRYYQSQLMWVCTCTVKIVLHITCLLTAVWNAGSEAAPGGFARSVSTPAPTGRRSAS